MKKNVLISLVACFIALGSFVHYNFSQDNHNTDISLADISVMAQAEGENPTHSATYYCYDTQDWSAIYGWPHIFLGRVCPAPSCGSYYHLSINLSGKCTVFYYP